MWSFVRERALLVAICVALPVAEAAALLVWGPAGSPPIAPHVTALSPLDIFHDLRWLLGYHPSLPAFALEALALVAFRATLLAVIVGQAWPPEARPPWRRLLARTSVFVVTALVLLLPWAALLFGVAVVSVSWLFIAGLPPVLVIAALLHPAVVARGWWRRPPLRTVGWVGLSFLVLTATGMAASLAPPWAVPVVAGAGGLFNAWAWASVVGHVTTRPAPGWRFPWAPVGVAAIVATAVGGAAIGFQLATPDPVAATSGVAAQRTGRPVLLVTGFNSEWDGSQPDFLPGPFAQWRFSYRGLSADGEPLPYRAEMTKRAVPELVAVMDDHVAALHRISGEPVTIVAESEGSVIAKVYAAAHPDAPVSDLVLLSPLVEPARVFYPPSGDEGWGAAGGWALRGISVALEAISPLQFESDAAVIRSLLDQAPVVRNLIGCPLPGVDESLVIPLADAVALPSTMTARLPTVVVPAFHGGLSSDGPARRVIRSIIEDGEAPASPGWATLDRLIRSAAAGWQVPSLPLHLHPGHRGGQSCEALVDDVRDWLAGESPAALPRGFHRKGAGIPRRGP